MSTLDEQKYASRCSKRMESVLSYVKEAKFFNDVCAGALSAIPRWKFARVLEAKGSDGISPRLGKAISAFFKSTRTIICGENVLVEHIINREPSADTLRMSLFGALMRSYLYLADKHD